MILNGDSLPLNSNKNDKCDDVINTKNDDKINTKNEDRMKSRVRRMKRSQIM